VNPRRPIFTDYVGKIFKLVTVGEGAFIEHFFTLHTRWWFAI